MVRGAKLRIHGTVFAAGRGTKGDTAKGCLEEAKRRRREGGERETRRSGEQRRDAIYASDSSFSLEFQRGNHGRLGGYVY